MWVTEVRKKETGRLLGRVEHGSDYNKAKEMWAALVCESETVHLIWEE